MAEWQGGARYYRKKSDPDPDRHAAAIVSIAAGAAKKTNRGTIGKTARARPARLVAKSRSTKSRSTKSRRTKSRRTRRRRSA
jgi:hypothetical protein